MGAMAEVARKLDQPLIERLAEVPQYIGILPSKLPSEFASHIVALDVGRHQYTLLVTVEITSNPALTNVLSSLQATLIGNRFFPSKHGADLQFCSKSVIQQLLNNGKAILDAHSSKAAITHARDDSEAQDRYEEWLRLAAAENASDLHVQVTGNGRALVQIRVDGELFPIHDGRGGICSELEAESSIGYLYNTDGEKGTNSDSIWTRGKNQYVMTKSQAVGGKQIALRVQSLPGHSGPKMVARILNVDINQPTLSFGQLGYTPSQEALFDETSRRTKGFVLFAGSTGSGKTTTNKSFIELHPGNGKLAFYELADPREYVLKGVHQISFQRNVANEQASSNMFREAAASLMRADPDVAIIGEIRDGASANLGSQLVLTGHLAIATTHADEIAGILPRLTQSDIGMSREGLAVNGILNLLSYQSLVPLLCPHCALPLGDAIQQHRALGHEKQATHLVDVNANLQTKFDLDGGLFRYRSAEGCNHCRGRGIKGSTVVAEMVIPDRQWLRLSKAGLDDAAMLYYRQASDRSFTSDNMDGKTVFEHALYKATKGWIDPLVCENFASFKRFEVHPEFNISDWK